MKQTGNKRRKYIWNMLSSFKLFVVFLSLIHQSFETGVAGEYEVIIPALPWHGHAQGGVGVLMTNAHNEKIKHESSLRHLFNSL